MKPLDIYKNSLDVQEFLRAAEEEKSRWLPACDQDHLELLAFLEEACARLKRANEVRLMEVWDKRVLDENTELKVLLAWCIAFATGFYDENANAHSWDDLQCFEKSRIDEIILEEMKP